MNLIVYVIEMGCDINGQVTDKKNDLTDGHRKWGAQHFIMKFPSLKLIKFFKQKIRDFNAQNNQNMTPLHLFCKNVKKGNLLETSINLPIEYETENVL
jgi:hypothetical protein